MSQANGPAIIIETHADLQRHIQWRQKAQELTKLRSQALEKNNDLAIKLLNMQAEVAANGTLITGLQQAMSSERTRSEAGLGDVAANVASLLTRIDKQLSRIKDQDSTELTLGRLQSNNEMLQGQLKLIEDWWVLQIENWRYEEGEGTLVEGEEELENIKESINVARSRLEAQKQSELHSADERQRERHSLLALIRDLSMRRDEQQRAVQERQDAVANAEARLKTETQQQMGLQTSVTDLTRELSVLGQAYQDARNQTTDLNRRITEGTDLRQALQADNDRKQREMDSALRSLQADLNKTANERRNTLEPLIERNEALRHEVDAVQQEVNAMISRIVERRASIAALERIQFQDRQYEQWPQAQDDNDGWDEDLYVDDEDEQANVGTGNRFS
ncbi:hypothetical protein HDZ31DRAFT_67707 [Schizophyllum fasciatum]